MTVLRVTVSKELAKQIARLQMLTDVDFTDWLNDNADKVVRLWRKDQDKRKKELEAKANEYKR